MSETVREVAEQEFSAEVVEASRERPVVVDFWAPWCGPCHQLSPVLERVAERYAGEVDVVKVNVDEAPAVAREFRIQGIPAVKAFRDGEVVAEFTGVQPEAAVDRFVAGLAPTEADSLVAAAAGSDGQAEDLLRQALASDPAHEGAVIGLARLLVGRGETEEARVLLERVPASPEARRLKAELALAGVAEADLEGLEAAAGAGDPHARLELGRVLAARGEHQRSLQLLLDAVRDGEVREDARRAILDVFEVLGPEHDLVRTSRPKLAAALY